MEVIYSTSKYICFLYTYTNNFSSSRQVSKIIDEFDGKFLQGVPQDFYLKISTSKNLKRKDPKFFFCVFAVQLRQIPFNRSKYGQGRIRFFKWEPVVLP